MSMSFLVIPQFVNHIIKNMKIGAGKDLDNLYVIYRIGEINHQSCERNVLMINLQRYKG